MRKTPGNYLSLFTCSLLLIVFGLCLSLTSGATLFSDNFEDGNSTGWSTSNGSWSVVTDGSRVYKQSSTSTTAHAYGGTASWANYAAEARAKALSFNGTARYFGLMARYQSSSNYYFLTLSNANTLELKKKVGGGVTVLASKSLAVATGTWYTLKLVVNGASLSGYVNGSLELSATDSSLATGRIGCTTYNASAEFDDILVDDLGGTATPTPTPSTATPTPTPSTATPTPTPSSATPTPTSVPGTPTPTPVPANGDLFVAPNGADNNPGTINSPTTFTAALTRIAPGKTIWVRGGTYAYSTEVEIAPGNNGTSGSPKKIFAYGSEKPIFDFSSQPFTSNEENPRGIKLAGDYWHLKGLEISGAADNGLYLCGDYNTVELCVFHHNRDSGLQISRYDNHTASSDWPSYNLVLNCTSYDNRDPDEEDADGFACKLTSGDGNVFRGCIAYHNCDDGWDLFTKPATGPIGEVLIEDCVAYENGYATTSSGGIEATSGDGNGFKLGGSEMPVNHTIRRSIAFHNRVKGVHYNSNSGSILVENCTSWDNHGGGNFVFLRGTHIFKNNLSYYNPSKKDEISGTDVESTNCWWIGNASVNAKGLVVSAEDFASLTPAISRNADGGINLGNFLKLAPGSDLINAGTPSGTDIGARESY